MFNLIHQYITEDKTDVVIDHVLRASDERMMLATAKAMSLAILEDLGNPEGYTVEVMEMDTNVSAFKACVHVCRNKAPVHTLFIEEVAE